MGYKRAYHWIGLCWVALLLCAGVFYFAHAGWELMPGAIGFLSSYVLALTPLIGWAAAAAYAFMMGQMVHGVVYTGLLVVAGVYFFWITYKSSPDFYDEALGVTSSTARADDSVQSDAVPLVAQWATGNADFETNSNSYRGIGAAVFFDKHLLEESGGWSSRTRIPWFRNTRVGAVLELIGGEIFAGMVFAILWGLYARGLYGNVERIAMLFRTIGVPSGNILAVLIPSVLILAAYPQYDRGFIELHNPYFYLVPESAARKLLWVSMARIVKVCAVALLVLVPAGVVSGTSIVVVLATLLAYFSSAFMVLGLRLAALRIMGVVFGGWVGRAAGYSSKQPGQQRLASTLPVIIFVLAGVVGMLAMFYFGPESYGLVVAILGFAVYCGLVGVLGLALSLKVLHDIDAPV
ncbi:MAG: putative ABC exporter domain-containing protein [Defluviitaleaceae bacterium]|nr:putative ABC exporter domain-containing protein [Defluviitaleaceae bacterium]